MTEKTSFILRFLLFAMVHSLFASTWVKSIFHGTNSRKYRLYYNAASLVMFGWVMATCRHSDVLYFIPGVWSLIMHLLQLVVAAILVSCLRQTGVGEFFGFKSTSGTFTRTGWYSIVRHPLYFFSSLFMVLNPVMTSQWLMLTILSTAYFIIGGLIEERRLTIEFGEEYRHYRQQVPFFIPNPARLKTYSQVQH